MKLKKYYKYVIVLCTLLLVFILIILLKSDFSLFKSKRNTDSNITANLALIINNDADLKDISELQESIKLCSSTFEKSYSTFKVSDYHNSYEDTIVAALKCGATLVVCPDSSFEETIYQLQNSYRGITFLIIDGIPHNSDNSDSTLNFNVIALTFDDAEAGFFAGYSAVYEGYTHISFLGLENDTQSVKYCYGFLQGADAAANDIGTTGIRIDTSYSNKENCADIADKMYDNGSELIAACSKEIVNNIIPSAKSYDKRIISCNDNSPSDSKYIIASTIKNYYLPATDCITQFYQGNLRAGTIEEYGTSDNAISLEFKTSDFKRFDSKIYDSIYLQLANNEIQIISDTTILPDELGLNHIILNK